MRSSRVRSSPGCRSRGSFLAWWFVLAIALCAFGQASADSVPGIDNVHFRTFGTAQGLSQATVRVMAQDRTGFVWIGTQDGLNRFDGYGFRVYKSDREDPFSLSQNHVWALAADPDGSLWVGTQAGGLNHYDSLLDRFTAYRADARDPHAIASNHVTALLVDRDRRLWVANSVGRLQWFDRGTRRFEDVPVGVHPELRMVRTLLQASDGRIWLGSRDALWRIEADGTGLRERRIGGVAPDVYALAQS